MRLLLAALAAAIAAGAALAQGPADPAALKAAVEEANRAVARSRAFDQQAARATDDAARVRAEAEALAARIQASEAEITAAETRGQIAAALLQDQRARLAERQGPLIRLTTALVALTRRPPALALAQPGSLDNAVRVRSVLAAALPRIRDRTAAVRTEIARTRALQAQAGQAAQVIAARRTELADRRTALAALETRQRARSQSLAGLALLESDRALALGEEARAIEVLVGDRAFQQRLARRLAELPGPVQRPGNSAAPPSGAPAYLMPFAGRLVTGVGELSEAGVHARGLTLAVAAASPIRAPANGRVAFAGPFRSYGAILILDHGSGWTSVITNLGTLAVAAGAQVTRGTEVGRAPDRETLMSIELRYEGRPVPPTALLR